MAVGARTFKYRAYGPLRNRLELKTAAQRTKPIQKVTRPSSAPEFRVTHFVVGSWAAIGSCSLTLQDSFVPVSQTARLYDAGPVCPDACYGKSLRGWSLLNSGKTESTSYRRIRAKTWTSRKAKGSEIL